MAAFVRRHPERSRFSGGERDLPCNIGVFWGETDYEYPGAWRTRLGRASPQILIGITIYRYL